MFYHPCLLFKDKLPPLNSEENVELYLRNISNKNRRNLNKIVELRFIAQLIVLLLEFNLIPNSAYQLEIISLRKYYFEKWT